MRKDFKRQVLITLGVFFGGILVLGGGLLLLKNKVVAKVDEIVKHRESIQQASALTEILANLKNEKQAAENYSRALEQFVVTRDELFVGFSQWLQGQARLYNVGVNFDFEGSEVPSAGGEFGHVGFSLKISGSLTDMDNFLKYLEEGSNKFLLAFSGFNLNQSQGAFSVTANGIVYFK